MIVVSLLSGSDERRFPFGPDGRGEEEMSVPPLRLRLGPGCEGWRPDDGQHPAASFREVPALWGGGGVEGEHGRPQQTGGKVSFLSSEPVVVLVLLR